MSIGVKVIVTQNDNSAFDTDEYVVDINRKFGGHEKGDIVIIGSPLSHSHDVPLELELAIRIDGTIIFRGWRFVDPQLASRYFRYFNFKELIGIQDGPEITPTPAQCETVAGLFSKRIRFEGLRLYLGRRICKICPFDIDVESKKVGRQLYY
ncbi:hypothetical protein SAMN05421670_3005 [Psychrobacillus psychrotolerans]|uniref:Uncharacterized protein n=1 Tax=Psychrobacillus psychrotolerans TaxID=126156 RepID=A0A1I5ZZE2_9BACI|nr:hypothetical protein [Psychrobacillus psychrotolerans]SFQ61864.1 hypothetical protein SAMN05421670_3005 [Psychrobacillus psychrotolerans]